MRGSILTYGEKLDELREIIVRTIAPEKIPLLLEELAGTDWQALALPLQIYWQKCIFCQTSFRLTKPPWTKLYCSLCATDAFKREVSRVATQCTRARCFDHQATLTIKEWLETLDYFERKCAYCGDPFSDMDHFIPITQQGGTTKDNCIPTCHRCNALKDNLHPNEVTRLPRKDIERVANYLSSKRAPDLSDLAEHL